jgi:outer membrane protein TolC
MFISSLNQGCAALALLALASLSSWASDPLTLAQAQQIAERRSRALVALDAGVSASREMAVAAGQLPDPVLKTGLNSLPVSGPDRFSLTRDSFTMLSVGVMQEFTRADKRKARAGRFDREAQVAAAGRALALTDLRQGTAQAWLARHFQERMRALLLEQRAETALQIEAADGAYRGGRASQADLFAARTAVAQIDERIAQVEIQIANASTKLARWVGADAALALAAPPALDRLGLQNGELEARIERHPQIVLVASQEAVARAEAEIAQSNRRSDWSVELMVGLRGSSHSNMVSLNASIPLQWDQRNRQDRELSARLALADQLRAQREETMREHLAQARGWLQQWQGNRGRLEQYDNSLIPLSAERLHAALAAYRGGAGSLLAVLEARRMVIETRIERLRLEMETAALWAQLEYQIPAEHQASAPVRPVAAKEQQP